MCAGTSKPGQERGGGTRSVSQAPFAGLRGVRSEHGRVGPDGRGVRGPLRAVQSSPGTRGPLACNSGDPASFPRMGRSAREGIGYPLQYPAPQDPSPLRGTLGSSLRSPAEGEGPGLHSQELAWPPRLSAGRRESGSQRPWLGEAAPQPEGSSVCVAVCTPPAPEPSAKRPGS